MLTSGILAATMSTTSSGLASVSTAIVTDFMLRLRWTEDTGVDSRLALTASGCCIEYTDGSIRMVRIQAWHAASGVGLGCEWAMWW